MKQITIINRVEMVISVILLSIITGCGTSYSIKQPLAPTPLKTSVYVMGSCNTPDNKTDENICTVLHEQIRYDLFKKGLYEKSGSKAPREVNLTITYFRNVGGTTRAWFGVLCGKDGLDVTVNVVDKQTGSTVGIVSASHFNVTAADYSAEMMAQEVSKKIVEYLANGEKSK